MPYANTMYKIFPGSETEEKLTWTQFIKFEHPFEGHHPIVFMTTMFQKKWTSTKRFKIL